MRHTDWKFWEDGAQLRFNPHQKRTSFYNPSNDDPNSPVSADSGGHSFRHLHGLKQFILELEMIEEKKAELDAIISRAPSWHFHIRDGGMLALNANKTEYYTWRGFNRSTGPTIHTEVDIAGAKPQYLHTRRFG